MTQNRYCKFENGAIKAFEEILQGDIFQIFEPDGTLLTSLCEKKFTYFLAEKEYDDEHKGFTGVWFK